MGLEIIEQVPDVDAVVIPVGGGGLIAGCAVALKTMNPNIKIIVRNWLIICFDQLSVCTVWTIIVRNHLSNIWLKNIFPIFFKIKANIEFLFFGLNLEEDAVY